MHGHKLNNFEFGNVDNLDIFARHHQMRFYQDGDFDGQIVKKKPSKKPFLEILVIFDQFSKINFATSGKKMLEFSYNSKTCESLFLTILNLFFRVQTMILSKTELEQYFID